MISEAPAEYKASVSDFLNNQVLKTVKSFDKIAESRNQTLAEMALAWLLHDGIITSVLIGASKPSQILDNIKALENTSFSQEELKQIDQLSGQTS